ncbi:MAG: hypothetical protein AABN33_20140 [Acidobacteriota bacterium]
MAIDTNAPEKVCPICNEGYPKDDNYCGKDGTRLVISDFNSLSKNSLGSRLGKSGGDKDGLHHV